MTIGLSTYGGIIAYLRANDFKTYIVSGGGVDFMSAFVLRFMEFHKTKL